MLGGHAGFSVPEEGGNAVGSMRVSRTKMHLADAMAPEVLVPVHTFEGTGIRIYSAGMSSGGRMANGGRFDDGR